MASTSIRPIAPVSRWTCRSCRLQSRKSLRDALSHNSTPRHRLLSSSTGQLADGQIRAAPEIHFERKGKGKGDLSNEPARIIPQSASYFTTIPVFNDHILQLRRFMKDLGSMPILRAEDAPRISWMSLEQVRSATGEKVGAAKYSQLLRLLRRLNLIHPRYRSPTLTASLEHFRRPGSVEAPPPKPSTMDEFGRSTGVGRRKCSVAKVYLVEGTGEVMINGQSIIQAFPRIHDRESAMWPLKITNRIDKYNAFVLTHGGGLTGQAESVTLAIAKALLVHEPALKPALRKAGCITRIMKRVERKKPGRVKARKRPTWVKR